MGPCIHQLTTVWLTSIATCCDIGAVTADSFQAQFSSPVHYGLAIAGISLGAAIAAALFVLLIYCLVKRRQREDEKDATRSDTEVTNSINSRGGAGVVAGASNFGPMALPGVAKPAEAVRNGGKVQTADAGNGAGVRGGSGSGGGDSGGRKRTRPVPANVQYTNPAFSSSSNQLDGAAVVGSTTSLFRNSSLLRPVSYTASLESNKPSDRPDSLAPGKSSAALIQHPQSAAMVRVLPTQIEEELLGRKKHPAPPPPPQAVQVGPSFPKTATRSDSFARQQKPQPEQVEDPVPPRHRGLNRVNLGGEEDGRSVTSTVLKQEALQAFEFLDTLE
uniref:Transmembrane protein n=1 Tax=Macrostomum lignano TaxID=282301 RepID=A0A1I8IQM1_9PLAT